MSHTHVDPSDTDLSSSRSQEVSPNTHPFVVTASPPPTRVTPQPVIPTALPLPASPKAPRSFPKEGRLNGSTTDATPRTSSASPPRTPPDDTTLAPISREGSAALISAATPNGSVHTLQWAENSTRTLSHMGSPNAASAPGTLPTVTSTGTTDAQQMWLRRVKGAASTSQAPSPAPTATTTAAAASPVRAENSLAGLSSAGSNTASLALSPSGPLMKEDTLPPSFTRSPHAGGVPTTPSLDDVEAETVAPSESASLHRRQAVHSAEASSPTRGRARAERDQEPPADMPMFRRVSQTEAQPPVKNGATSSPGEDAPAVTAVATATSVSWPVSGASDMFEYIGSSRGTSMADVQERAPFHTHRNRSPADYSTSASMALEPGSPAFRLLHASSTLGDNSQLGTPTVFSTTPAAQPTSGARTPLAAVWHSRGGSSVSDHVRTPITGMGVAAATPPQCQVTEVGTPLALSMEGSPVVNTLSHLSGGAVHTSAPTSRMRRHRRQRSSVLDMSLSVENNVHTLRLSPPTAPAAAVSPFSHSLTQGNMLSAPIATADHAGAGLTIVTTGHESGTSPDRSGGAAGGLPGARSSMFFTPFRMQDGDRTPLTARLEPAGPSFFYLRYEEDPVNTAPTAKGGKDGSGQGTAASAAVPRGRYAYRTDSQFFAPAESFLLVEQTEEHQRQALREAGEGVEAGQKPFTSTRAHHRRLNEQGRSLRERIQKLRDHYLRSLRRHAKDVKRGQVVPVSEVRQVASEPAPAPYTTVGDLASPMLASASMRADGPEAFTVTPRSNTRACFDQPNVIVERYDTVRFRWRDPRERIIETTSDFFQEFPGGMHSPPIAFDDVVQPILMASSSDGGHVTCAGTADDGTVTRGNQAHEACKMTVGAVEVEKQQEMLPSAAQVPPVPLRDGSAAPAGETPARVVSGTGGVVGGDSLSDSRTANEVPAGVASPTTVKDADYKMRYDLVFADPGDYYFVCTTDHRTMRLHVQVRDTEPIWWLRYLWLCLLAVLVCLVVALITFGITLAVAKGGILSKFIDVEQNNTAQQDSLDHIDALLTRHLLPWLVLGVLGFIVTAVAWIVWTGCCQRRPQPPDKHVPSTFRGYTLHTRKGWAWATIAITFLCFAMAIGIWGALLTAVYNTSTAVNVLVDSVFGTVHSFRTAIQTGESIVGALPDVLSDSVDVPYGQINSTLDTIDDTLSDINGWVAFIANMILAGIRALPFLSFLMLQLTVVACLYAILGAFFRFAHSTHLAVWLCLLSMAGVAIGVGFYWCFYGALDVLSGLVSSFTYQNDTSGAEWAARVMFPSTSPLAELYDACIPGGLLSTENVAHVLNDTVNSIYDSLDEQERKDYQDLFDLAGPLTNATGELYDNYFYWVAAQAAQMQAYMTSVGDDSGLKKAAPLISSGISVAMTLATALNCDVFRDLFVDVIPLLQQGMINTVRALYVLYMTLFGLIFVAVVIIAITTFVLFHPRKNWYHFRSRRWFRLHWSYLIHKRLVERGAVPGLDAYQEEEYRRTSARRHLNKCRHAAMFLSLLLLVDGVVMAILARFNDRHNLLVAGPFLLFAQCVLFSFGYVLVHYRVLLEQLCTLGSCLCLLAFVVTQLITGIDDLVKFADCVTQKRAEHPEQTALYPLRLSCPPLTMASYLEEALYTILTSLVALAVAILQLFLLLHPLQLRLLWGNVRALRASRAVLHISPKSRRTRWVVWAAASVLLLALLLGLVLAEQKPITLTSDTNRTDDSDTAIVNVVNPSIGCNGNRAYCWKRVNELIWLAAHNAYSSQDLGYVTPNHYWDMRLQLEAGVRFFLIDPWYDRVDPNNASSPEEVYLCHSICLIGRNLMRTALEPLAQFLRQYPEEVVVLDLEQYVTTADIGRVLEDLDLLQYTWQPNSTPIHNPDFLWPTLGDLAGSNQRLLVFGTEENYTKPDHPPWMLPRSYYRYETKWTTYEPDQFNCRIDVYWCSSMPNPEYNTSYNRVGFANCSDPVLGPYKNESYVQYMEEHHALPQVMRSKLALINSMVTIGVAIPSSAAQVNQPSILQALTGRCAKSWGRIPNVVAVDYWNVGNGLQQVVDMNNLIAKYGPTNWVNHIGVPLYVEYNG